MMPNTPNANSSASDTSHASSALEKRQLDIRELLGDDVEIVLIHAGEKYRLRITANNKLILTK